MVCVCIVYNFQNKTEKQNQRNQRWNGREKYKHNWKSIIIRQRNVGLYNNDAMVRYVLGFSVLCFVSLIWYLKCSECITRNGLEAANTRKGAHSERHKKTRDELFMGCGLVSFLFSSRAKRHSIDDQKWKMLSWFHSFFLSNVLKFSRSK